MYKIKQFVGNDSQKEIIFFFQKNQKTKKTEETKQIQFKLFFNIENSNLCSFQNTNFIWIKFVNIEKNLKTKFAIIVFKKKKKIKKKRFFLNIIIDKKKRWREDALAPLLERCPKDNALGRL